MDLITEYNPEVINYYYWFSCLSYCDDKKIEEKKCCYNILDKWDIVFHKEYNYTEGILDLFIDKIYQLIEKISKSNNKNNNNGNNNNNDINNNNNDNNVNNNNNGNNNNDNNDITEKDNLIDILEKLIDLKNNLFDPGKNIMETLKSFIKDNIQYYGDQYSASDIDTDEYLTNEYIEDDFLNYEDRIKDLTTFWTGVCFAKQFYIPLTDEFYPHIAFYVGIRFEFFKYSDGTMYVDLHKDDDYINQQTEYQFFDKNGEEYDMDVIINIIEESQSRMSSLYNDMIAKRDKNLSMFPQLGAWASGDKKVVS